MTRSPSRVAAATGLAALLAAALPLGLAPSPAIGDPDVPQVAGPGADGYDKADRERLQQAREDGEERVTVLVAAEDGELPAAVEQLRSLGATIEARNGRVDYVKASVPTSRAGKVPGLDAVAAVDVDGLVRMEDPRPGTRGQVAPVPQRPPGKRTPRVNPYMPTTDTGAAEFALDTGYDGTGTTVAILDSGVDLDHPALRRLPDGSRKILDWYNANATNSGDGTWVPVSGSYSGPFSASGRTWTPPPDGGPYAFGLFRESALDLATGELGGDVDRDGVRGETFGVLQDTSTKEVRVDLDNDGSFADQRRMIDYRVNRDVGYFGRDRAATRVVDRVAFVVQTDKPGWVDLGLSAAHGTHVAGIATGHDLFGGDVQGAAPGAEVISIKACLTTSACTASGLLDGVLYGATHGADVMNISIGGLPALNDGNNARAELYDRTIDEYGMQIVISAGNNGAGANTVGDPSVASHALSVASSVTDETWLSNYGSVTTLDGGEGLHPFSSRGPREDGGFKPQLAAPGSAISSTPRWQAGGPVSGTFGLAPGYSMFNGTSMAAPQTTGAIALLIDAYEEEYGERPSPAALRTALMSSARFLEGVGAYEQGAGVVDVPAAWDLLQDLGNTGGGPDSVTTSVPVSTIYSAQLRTPGLGTGIHDREGVTAGESYRRTYTLTRTTGPEGTRTYDVGWLGDDGTFSAPSSVDLPLGEAVQLPVDVDPTSPGAHSAILRLDDPDTVGVDAQTMNAVFATAAATAENGHTVSRSGVLGPNETESLFVDVPEGTAALRVDLQGGGDSAGSGQLRFTRYSPAGVGLDGSSSSTCYVPATSSGCAGSATSRTVTDPLPGVWEVVVDARRTSDSEAAPYQVDATLLGATVSPDPDVVPSATVGVPVERSYTVTNTRGAFTGRLTGGPLGSARILSPTIRQDEQQQYQLSVPAGASEVSARIGNPSDPAADLDLTLYRCAPSCSVVAQSADGDSEESVRVANPPAGTYLVLVSGYSVPPDGITFGYRDMFVSSGLGSVQVADTDAPRALRAQWTVPGTLTVGAGPGSGRVLLGTLTVRDDANTMVGTGEVRVQQP